MNENDHVREGPPEEDELDQDLERLLEPDLVRFEETEDEPDKEEEELEEEQEFFQEPERQAKGRKHKHGRKQASREEAPILYKYDPSMDLAASDTVADPAAPAHDHPLGSEGLPWNGQGPMGRRAFQAERLTRDQEVEQEGYERYMQGMDVPERKRDISGPSAYMPYRPDTHTDEPQMGEQDHGTFPGLDIPMPEEPAYGSSRQAGGPDRYGRTGQSPGRPYGAEGSARYQPDRSGFDTPMGDTLRTGGYRENDPFYTRELAQDSYQRERDASDPSGFMPCREDTHTADTQLGGQDHGTLPGLGIPMPEETAYGSSRQAGDPDRYGRAGQSPGSPYGADGSARYQPDRSGFDTPVGDAFRTGGYLEDNPFYTQELERDNYRGGYDNASERMDPGIRNRFQDPMDRDGPIQSGHDPNGMDAMHFNRTEPVQGTGYGTGHGKGAEAADPIERWESYERERSIAQEHRSYQQAGTQEDRPASRVFDVENDFHDGLSRTYHEAAPIRMHTPADLNHKDAVIDQPNVVRNDSDIQKRNEELEKRGYRAERITRDQEVQQQQYNAYMRGETQVRPDNPDRMEEHEPHLERMGPSAIYQDRVSQEHVSQDPGQASPVREGYGYGQPPGSPPPFQASAGGAGSQGFHENTSFRADREQIEEDSGTASPFAEGIPYTRPQEAAPSDSMIHKQHEQSGQGFSQDFVLGNQPSGRDTGISGDRIQGTAQTEPAPAGTGERPSQAAREAWTGKDGYGETPRGFGPDGAMQAGVGHHGQDPSHGYQAEHISVDMENEQAAYEAFMRGEQPKGGVGQGMDGPDKMDADNVVRSDNMEGTARIDRRSWGEMEQPTGFEAEAHQYIDDVPGFGKNKDPISDPFCKGGKQAEPGGEGPVLGDAHKGGVFAPGEKEGAPKGSAPGAAGTAGFEAGASEGFRTFRSERNQHLEDEQRDWEEKLNGMPGDMGTAGEKGAKDTGNSGEGVRMGSFAGKRESMSGEENPQMDGEDSIHIFGKSQADERQSSITFIDTPHERKKGMVRYLVVGNIKQAGRTVGVRASAASKSNYTLSGIMFMHETAGRYVVHPALQTGTRVPMILAGKARAKIGVHLIWKGKKFSKDYETIHDDLKVILKKKYKKDNLTDKELEEKLKPTKFREFRKLKKTIQKELQNKGFTVRRKGLSKILKKSNISDKDKAWIRVYLKMDKMTGRIDKSKIPFKGAMKKAHVRISMTFRTIVRKMARESDNSAMQGALYTHMVARRLLKISARMGKQAMRVRRSISNDARIVRNVGKTLTKAPKGVTKATVQTGKFVKNKILTGGAHLTKYVYKAGERAAIKITQAGTKAAAKATTKVGAKVIQTGAKAAAKAAQLIAKGAAWLVSQIVSAVAALATLFGPIVVIILLVLILLMGLTAAFHLNGWNSKSIKDIDYEELAVSQYIEALNQCHEDYKEAITDLYTNTDYETVTVTYKDEKNEDVYVEYQNEFGFVSSDNNIKEEICLMTALFDFGLETYIVDDESSEELKQEDLDNLQAFMQKVDIEDENYSGTYQKLIRTYLIALFNGSHEIDKRVEIDYCEGCVDQFDSEEGKTVRYCPGHRHLYVTVTTYYFDQLFECGLKQNPDSFNLSIVGSNTVEKLWYGLLSAGLTEEATAGVIGNLMWESGGGPNDVKLNAVEAVYAEGIGMMQWSFSRKTEFLNFLASKGETWPNENVEVQLEFLLKELYGGQWMWAGTGFGYPADTQIDLEGFINCTDVAKATEYFCANFGRCRYKDAHMDTRIEFAMGVYNTYHGKQQGVHVGDSYSLTDGQLRAIARLCQQEQGTVTGAMAEASLMANRFEKYGTVAIANYGTGGTGLYNYVKDSGWFANASYWMGQTGSLNDNIYAAVREVLVNGNRTLPDYVDEHDYIGDIAEVSNNGVAFNPNDRSKYISGVTKIRNKMGSTYTFYCFPDNQSDPFGYTNS